MRPGPRTWSSWSGTTTRCGPAPRRGRRGWPPLATSVRISSSGAVITGARSPRWTCRCCWSTAARIRPCRPATPPRRPPGSRGPRCAGWTRVVTSPIWSIRRPSTAGWPSSWSGAPRRADERDQSPGSEDPAGRPAGAALARRAPGLGDQDLPAAERRAHPDRGDRAARGRAQPRRRDRRVLPRRRAERRRRRVSALAGLSRRAQPGRRSRPLGADGRSHDASVLMGEGALRVERRGGVARCTLDRPPLNLLEPGLIAALRAAFVELAADASVRVAVLTGAGRAFTAGMDVRVLRDLDPAGATALITSLHDAVDAVHRAPFPVVAAVNGHALGAGFELALACDVRIAVVEATFGLPEVRVGVPSVIQAALLPALVGPGRAAELLLTGASIGAGQALAWGLVNRVVERAELEAAVEAMGAAITACAPGAVRLQKQLIVRWRENDLPTAVRAGIAAFAASYATGEPREGTTAFLEKRPPRFGESS